MKKCVCQSCGMPLHKPDMYGTGADGSHIEEYCVYCYRNGQFTQEVTMEEMLRLCANFVEPHSRDYYLASMRMQYPHLKRWARKEDTQHQYYKSINRVLEYIRQNLSQQADLKTLAAIAHISPFHFHRIFRSIIGESLAGYVQRLRLEFVARQLQESALSLGELALRTAYSSEQALSRAFKKYFGIPPKAFKVSFYHEKFHGAIVPRICRVAARNVIFLRQPAEGSAQWQKLYTYGLMKRLLSDSTESIEVICGGVFLPSLSTREPQAENPHVLAAVLPEGRYAIFTHKGDPARLKELYKAIFDYWLPAGNYSLAASEPYIVYLSHPATVAPENRLAEIYIPLAEKSSRPIEK